MSAVPVGVVFPTRWSRARAYLAQRPYLAPTVLAVATALATVIVALVGGLPIRDPDGLFGERLRLLLGTVLAFAAIDIVPRALVRASWRPHRLWSAGRAIVRERWTKKRWAIAVTGVASFYVTYVAYRNLKSFLPFYVDQNLDKPLLEVDRWLFAGHDPAVLLHTLLGTGAAATLLSAIYVFYLAFVPISVGAAVIWWMRAGPGFWYVTALGLNWVLGVLSYYLVPSLGPIFVYPGIFEALPETNALDLQTLLHQHRTIVMIDPSSTAKVQSIAGFASLHVSVVFTAALIAHHLRLMRVIRYLLWAFLALTIVATIYLGWHYILDDVGGLILGAVAVYGAAFLTGQSVRTRPGSEQEQADVVGGHRREEDRVYPVEDAPVGPERSAGVLDAQVALEERLEEVPDDRRRGDGQPEQDGAPAAHGPVDQRQEQPDRAGTPGQPR